jgi:hypothetical protein
MDCLVPLFGFIICLLIWLSLGPSAIVLGTVWMAVGVAYGAVKTKGFKTDLVRFDIPSDDA